MNKYLIIIMSIILFTYRIVCSNIAMNDKQDFDSLKTPDSDTNDNSFRRTVDKVPGIRLGKLGKNFKDIEALRKAIQDSPIDWQRYTAAPVPVEEPDCYVEVQVTQRMPGKCTLLGGRLPACQAKDLVNIDHSCK